MKSFSAFLLLLALAACDQNVVSKDSPPTPHTSTALPSAPQPMMPGTTAAPNAGGAISGKITVNAALKDKVPAGATVFVIARHGEVGPPLAAKKMPLAAFPMAYSIDSSNVMFAGSPFEGPLDIVIRIDQDGDAMTKVKGDLFGKKAAKVGDKDADVVIDQAIL